MKIDRPSIVFNGYFKGTIDKDADLRTFTSLSDSAALSVFENEDAVYYSHKKLKNNSALRYMDTVLMIRNIMKVNNEDGSVTFITVNCCKSGDKEAKWHYTYSVSIIVVRFDNSINYNYKPTKIKKMCLDCIMEEYKKYKSQINTLRDIGFDMLKKEK
jgi:hypothetical protein